MQMENRATSVPTDRQPRQKGTPMTPDELDDKEELHWIGDPRSGLKLFLRRLSPQFRGEWDGLTTDADAAWLLDAFSGSPNRRDIKLGRGTHLMHLEAGGGALWRASAACLSEPVPA
ncbi:hypothetical protein [Methylobacterium sp. A52T]